jgi:hypothetical protein
MTNNYGSGQRSGGDAHNAYRAQASQHFGMAPTVSEHQSIAILPDEEVVFGADFTSSPILRHIKTGLVVTNDRVVVRYPQYLFLFVKVGYAESSTPIQRICEVTTGRLLSRRRITSALMFGLFGLFAFMTGISEAGGIFGMLVTLLALALLAFAAFQAWMARSLGLTVTHAGGGTLHVDVDKLEFANMVVAGNTIQRLVLGTSSATARPPASIDVAAPRSTRPAPQAPPPAVPAARPVHTSAPAPVPMQYPQSAPPAPPTIWRA